jgi:hypothetical protein
MKTTIIMIDKGELFIGTREQFANCFFSNAEDEVILGWAKEQGFHVEFLETEAKDTDRWCRSYMKKLGKGR